MGKMKIGCCLFTVDDEFAKNPFDTLYKLADIGFEAVEIGAFTALSTGEWQGTLRKTGLSVADMHFGIDQQEQWTKHIMEFANQLGCRYIGCPVLRGCDNADADTYHKEAEVMNRLGKIYRENGFAMVYHNHSFEFKKFDGKYGLDILFEETDPAYVQFELDTYWVAHGGENPADYIRKFAGRVDLLHCKDMAEDRFFAPVGEGTLDFKEIVKAAQETGVRTLLVEQDARRKPSFECAQSSYSCLSALVG